MIRPGETTLRHLLTPGSPASGTQMPLGVWA